MKNESARKRIFIIGAGIAGLALAKEIGTKPIFGTVVAFLDDDPAKIGTDVNGIPIAGPLREVAKILARIPADEAIIAVPSATNEQLKRIYEIVSRAHFAKIRILPRLSQILDNSAHLIQTRDVNPEDFLGRTPVKVSLKKSLQYLRGKRVLITGAGGSIGSELARQLLSGGAARLYLFGHGENSVYEIERELKILQAGGVGEQATIVPIIGELQDKEYIRFLLERLAADVIFHAAAHKHVPLLEANPVEAIKNNVFGTQNLVQAALAAHTQRFVLVSTDKAVSPESIYGASKLIAEEIVLDADRGDHNFMVVRFGNVLGSRGSILPLFQKQIASGGPVSLTHPEVRRFFMTIPEAVSLVLKAGGTGVGGNLYVLDMGEPVYIKDIISQLIAFNGYVPDEDIKIAVTGLRPGEKLEERLYRAGEQVMPTDFPKIQRLIRARALQGELTPLLDMLRPICFFDADRPALFRDRERLSSLLGGAIPTLQVIPEHARRN